MRPPSMLAPHIGQQPHDRQRRDRLARPGLTDQPERLPRPNLDRQTIHRLDGPAIGMEVRLEVVNFEERCVGHASAFGGRDSALVTFRFENDTGRV